MPELPEIAPEQDQALRDAIAGHLGVPFVTDYVIIAKAVQAGGETGIADFASPDLAAWDQIGMVASINAAYTADFANRYNDD